MTFRSVVLSILVIIATVMHSTYADDDVNHGNKTISDYMEYLFNMDGFPENLYEDKKIVDNLIKDRYIIKLKPGVVNSIQTYIDNLIDEYSDLNLPEIKPYAIMDFLDAFTLEIPKVLVQHLTYFEDKIEFVEQDKIITVNNEVNQIDPNNVRKIVGATWGLDRIDQQSNNLDSIFKAIVTDVNNTSEKAVVNAYVMDTGIRTTHKEFRRSDGSSRAKFGFNAVNDGRDTDCQGHGTHVAGTIGGNTYGVCKDVILHAVKVLGCDGSGSLTDLVTGLNWIHNNLKRPAVINMSLGAGSTRMIDQAIDKLVSQDDVAIVVAAGNDDSNACKVSPARSTNVVTVGSLDKSDGRSSFSNWGKCVNIFAPGSGITSAGHRSDNDKATMSGTSMASPHVAGAVALFYRANSTISAKEVTDNLVHSSTKGKVQDPQGSSNFVLNVRDIELLHSDGRGGQGGNRNSGAFSFGIDSTVVTMIGTTAALWLLA